MNTDDDLLKIISNETKDSISNFSIVTPSIYASVFTKFAAGHGKVIDKETELAHDLILNECSNLTNLQNQTSKSVQQLSDNTDKAITAIKNNDEKLLGEVLKETNAMREEIIKLKEAVYKDELTHVYNRKWIHDNMLDEENKFLEDGTLSMIDLNFFKLINDTYGHIVGDKVLMFIANQLSQVQPSVIRYGGDEFIIIFKSNIDMDMAYKMLNDLREKIISKKLKSGNDSFKVSFSIGTYEFEKGDTLSDTIELADKNMYDDKIKIKKVVTGI